VNKQSHKPTTTLNKKGLTQDISFALDCQILLSDDYFKAAREAINTPKYTVKDIEFTYRIINSWASAGLLPERREDGSGEWRRLSVVDSVWIQLLQTMREFGFSLAKAKKAYSCLMQDKKGRDLKKIDAAILACLRKPPFPVFVVILEDGQAEVCDLHSIDECDHAFGYQNILRINVNAILKRLFKNLDQPVAPSIRMTKEEATRYFDCQGNLADDDESGVLGALRNENVTAVKVKKSGDRIKEIETTTFEQKDPKVFEILNGMDYGEFTVRVENGKPVHAQIRKNKRVKPITPSRAGSLKGNHQRWL